MLEVYIINSSLLPAAGYAMQQNAYGMAMPMQADRLRVESSGQNIGDLNKATAGFGVQGLPVWESLSI